MGLEAFVEHNGHSLLWLLLGSGSLLRFFEAEAHSPLLSDLHIGQHHSLSHVLVLEQAIGG